MLINDYHDWKLGVDNAQTKPGRPLVTGAVQPDTVKFVLKWAYAMHLTLLCLIDRASMRLWILANTLLTYLYSVHLKPITGVKNVVCAAIVAMGLGLGALCLDGTAALTLVWRPMAVVAGLICHREMVMDIKDASGDALAGVRTVPVVYGVNRAMGISLAPLAVAVSVAASSPGHFCSNLATAALLAQAALSINCLRCAFERRAMTLAIELAPLWLLIALVSLTV